MFKNTKFVNFLKSLKFRLILLITLIVVVPGCSLCMIILNAYENRAISIRESEVSSQAMILANQIATSEYMQGNGNDNEMVRAQLNTITSVYSGRVLVVNENYTIITDTYNMDEGKTILSQEVIYSFSGEKITKYDSENRYIEMTIPITNPDDKTNHVIGVLVASVSTDNVSLTLSYMHNLLTIIFLSLCVVLIALGGWVSFVLAKPLQKISEGIENIQAGVEDTLIVNDYSETTEICQKFNSMRSSMKAMDESRQEFVSNVSHELKTPLTSMKVLADSINSMPDAPIELYQEFMEDITNEIERETKIINDLLSLVKMDKSAADLNITTVNINELLEQILKRLQPIADRQQVELVLESFRPVTADVDEVKLTLALSNLVENAIKYNKIDGTGWVHVSLNADHQYFFVKVEDSGMGIPEDSLEHIYERFYRVDKSHSREIGGTGLGLAITRNSIIMHRGAIKVYSVLGEGTTFDVRIPLNYIV